MMKYDEFETMKSNKLKNISKEIKNEIKHEEMLIQIKRKI